MSYFTERAKELGIEVPGSTSERKSNESYFQKRARELGVSASPKPEQTTAPKSDFFTKRQMELGIIPNPDQPAEPAPFVFSPELPRAADIVIPQPKPVFTPAPSVEQPAPKEQPLWKRALTGTLEVIGRPGAAVRGVIDEATDGNRSSLGSVAKRAGNALAGKEHTSTTDILGHLGFTEMPADAKTQSLGQYLRAKVNNSALRAAGLVGDVATDPLTYLTFGPKGRPTAEPVTAPTSEPLALPLGRADAARLARAPQNGTEPIVNPYTFELPDPNIGAPTSARISQQVNPYRQQFEQELIPTAQRLQAEGRFTPGREREELESLWSQMAGREAPSLDELITQAYRPRPNRLSPDLVQRARSTQQAREVAGAPLPVRSMADRYPSGPMAQAAKPIQQIGRAQAVAKAQPSKVSTQPTTITATDAEKMAADYVRTNPNAGTAEMQRLFKIGYGQIQDIKNAVNKGTPYKGLERYYEAGKPVTGIVQPSQAARIDVTPTEAPAVRQPAPIVRNAPQATGGLRQRGFAETLQESEKPPQGFKDRLQSSYKPITNEETLKQANKRIDKDVESATSYVLGNSRFTAEKATTAQRLIDHYNGQGNYQRAVDIAQKVAEEATRAGQSIQALSMYNRLTPEGVLINAQRIANKVNENSGIFAREKKVTPEMAASITGLAQKTQEMTGVKDLSNNVIDILDRAKTGEKLSDSDAATLKQFVNESKQFIKETTKKPNKTPKPPVEPKNARIKNGLTSFLDAQEQAAKERLRSRGIQISSTPLDTWADYAVIGAAKMAKGAINFADWSAEMVKDLGESVRPHLQNLYDRAKEAFDASKKQVSSRSVSAAERLTEKVINAKQLEPAEADQLRNLALRVSNLSGDAKVAASQDLQVLLQSLENPSILKKISTTQTLAQLLNPKTQVRNALGNELFYRVERLNKLLATPIDIARSKITGGPRTVTFRTNNQGQYWRNWLGGGKAGWKGTNVNGLETQYDLVGQSFRGKYNPLTYLEKALGASLKSFDTAAYMRAYNNTLGEQATLRLINEGKKVTKEAVQKYIREADDNLQSIADQYGRYATFQDNNVISKNLVRVKRVLNAGQDFGVGDLVLKYPKTPGALLMRALEYSPAGFVRSGMMLLKPILKRSAEPNTAEVTQALTRAIIGTGGLSGMGYFLLDKGILTGSASKDKDIKGLQKAAGQGQYQVNLSALFRFVKSGFDPEAAKIKEGDTLYTYDWMQPVSMAVSMGANTAKNNKEGKQGLSGIGKTAFNSLEGGVGTLTEQSVLSGIKRAAEGYPGETFTDKMLDILSDLPSSFIPTGSNQIRQLMDNSTAETYSPDKIKQSLNFAQSKIPGLEKSLPRQYDTLGQQKTNYQDNNIFNVLFNPGFASKYKLSPEAKYIVDLIDETGDETLAPRVPAKTITVDGESIKLNGDMFSRLQQLQGEETRQRIEKLSNRDTTKKLETRSKNVTKALTDAGTAAKKQLRKEMGQ